MGISRQAHYQWQHRRVREAAKHERALELVRSKRLHQPRLGTRKLHHLIAPVLEAQGIGIGRDALFHLLRYARLLVSTKRAYHKTTNSHHRFRRHPNLLKAGPEQVRAEASEQVWVADITYLPTRERCAYLSLITDAYSHKIIGWKLADTLKAAITLDALTDAINQTGKEDLTGLIHHSDRGVQYCCDLYINTLNQYNISISMTEDSKPTDNAIAERVNGIIKQERIYRDRHFKNIDEARSVIGRFISFYNTKRPHMSIGMLTPEIVHQQTGEQKKMWKTKVYSSSKPNVKNIDVLLDTQQRVKVTV